MKSINYAIPTVCMSFACSDCYCHGRRPQASSELVEIDKKNKGEPNRIDSIMDRVECNFEVKCPNNVYVHLGAYSRGT